MKRVIDVLETGPLQVNCLLLGDAERGEAVLIDPGGHAQELLRHMQGRSLPKLAAILATHGHFDHIGAVAELQALTGAAFWLHPADRDLVAGAKQHAAQWGIPFGGLPRIDHDLADGQVLELAGLTLTILHTPGHTPGGVCVRWDDDLAVGDTLFAGSIGRTDLPGGNHRQLITSIETRLMVLDDAIRCHPGHGPSTTIGQERLHNPFLGE